MAEKPEQDDDLAPTSTARTEMEEPQEGDNRGDDRTEKQNIPNKLAENNDRNTNEIVRATTEDSKENSNRSTEEISAPERKKAAAVVGNTQTTPMASVIPHQEQQQQQIPISIQPAYNYNFPPTMGFMQNFMPAPSNLTGQASLNPSRYTDAAYIADPVPDMRRNRGGVTEPFPEKLHKMLEATDKEGKGDIVGFFSHGRAFAIHQPRNFVSDIMPRFFNQSRLTSFQRQLNLYGFKRISQGPDNGGYYHELFLKGRPGLVVNLKRTKVKGTFKKKRDPGSEPNFYIYPPIGTSHPSALAAPLPTLAPAVARTAASYSPKNSAAGSPAAAMPQLASTAYQMYPGTQHYPFVMAQQHILAPYTAAQKPTTVMYPIPPAAPQQHQLIAPAKPVATDPDSETNPATEMGPSSDTAKKGEGGEASNTSTGAEGKRETTTQATTGAISI